MRILAGLAVLSVVFLSAAARAAEPPPEPPPCSANVAAPGRKLALLIAIQGYGRFGKEWQDLDGTIDDILLMRNVLIDRFGYTLADITMVCDDPKTCSGRPTRKGITAAFEALIHRAQHGDLVYIHYSGHGSTVGDANGDEPGPNGRDSTWVPIDREKGASEILDDEIGIWLGRLGKQTDDVVLVSDSCHCGTITRGAKSLKTRGAPVTDVKDYSWSQALVPDMHSFASPPHNLVRISASRDDQEAHEYTGPDTGKKIYGRLTWFWAKALSAAVPGQTYDEVFTSVAAMMPRDNQLPTIEGPRNLQLFRHQFAERPCEIAAVKVNGAKVDFDAGLVNGVTKGSLFEQTNPAAGQKPLSVAIETANAYNSIGVIRGAGVAKGGDLFRETQHVYRLPPLRVSVRADYAKDKPVKQALTDALRSLKDGVEVVPESERADVILHLARVGLDDLGEPRLARDSLPTRDAPTAPLECWILDDSDHLYAPDLRVGLDHAPAGSGARARNEGIAKVTQDVEVILRNRGLLDIANLGATDLAGQISVETLRASIPRGDEAPADLVDIPFDEEHGGPHKQHLEVLQPNASGEFELKKGELITFRVANQSKRVRYFYVVNIGANGDAKVLFPERGFEEQEGQVEPGTGRTFVKATYEVEGPRDTYLWLITDQLVDAWGLEGGGYVRGRTAGESSPLNQLLRRAATGTRGKETTMKGTQEFATRKIVVRVR